MKRLFDIVLASIGLLMLCPLFLLIAVLIKLDTPGPIFFRQTRVGRYGRLFYIFKFRTMAENCESKGQLTVEQDSRITKRGRVLRRYKLDELPQLINVLTGDMSFVGPRPEVPYYCEKYPEELRKIVLSVRPGITDHASIKYKDESKLLSGSSDPEKTYVEEILPDKLQLYAKYVQTRSMLDDLRILITTLRAIVS